MATTLLKIPKGNIKGSSMYPLIKENCALIVNTRLSNFSLGDVVVFLNKRKLTAHRIIEKKISKNEKKYVLKGDNRFQTDSLIHVNRIIGRVEKIIYPKHKVDLTNNKHEILKYFLSLCSRLNLHFLFLFGLRNFHNISLCKKVYRLFLSKFNFLTKK